MGRTWAQLGRAVDRLLSRATRHNTAFLLFLISSFVGVVGFFVLRDIQSANAAVNELYSGSLQGLQRIGDLQYDAQETRRATLYALSTNDSNLQLEYADQSRAAGQQVEGRIADYVREARTPGETALAGRLGRDWDSYLEVRDEVLASILEGSVGEAVDRDLSRGVPAFDRVRRDVEEVKSLYGQEASRRLDEATEASRRSSLRLFGILGFALLLSGAAVWAIQRGRMLSTLELARLQMEFVASVSHELRTPLAVLHSASDNIADGLVQGPSDLRAYGVVLRKQSRRMAELVDQILLFASTEDRKQRYALRPIPITEVIAETISGTEMFLKEGGAVLDLQVDPDVPAVMAELTGVRQCLQNLIGNAVKYGGDQRRIVLRATASSQGRGPSQEVQISVIDRGIGIERSELSRIFEPFYRSPRVIAAQVHGTGLGLSLAKRIAEGMGGGITVSSEVAAGSTFTLHLRAATQDEVSAFSQSGRPGTI